MLVGESGRDLIIGGDGEDPLRGGSEEDILIGARVSFGTNDPVLKAMRDVWAKPVSYSQRINELRNVGIVLASTTYKLNAASIIADSAADQSYGDESLDWF